MTATPTQPKLSIDAQQSPELLLWDAPTTARMLSVSEETVRNLHRTRQLEGLLIGRHLRWAPEDVAEFISRVRAAKKQE